jgi:hypothetical protein
MGDLQCRKNWYWYRTGIRALTKYKPLAEVNLDQITIDVASEFAAHRLREGMQVRTANNRFACFAASSICR